MKSRAAAVRRFFSNASDVRVGPPFIIALLALLTTILLIAKYALFRYPYSGDEYSYYLQGEIFASGRLAAVAPAHPELFQVDHVVVDDLVRSKYPPAWPAWLALGWLVHAPWVVNPILGCGALAILFVTGRRLFGPSAALVSTLMVGASSFFLLNCASFHSHPSALLASAIFFWALTRAAESGSARDACLAGAGIGLLAVTRPGDALPLVFGAIVLVRRPKLLGALALGACPFVGAMLVYQANQYGGAFKSGYDAYEPQFILQYGTGSITVLSPTFALDASTQWAHVGWFSKLGEEFLAPLTMTLVVLGAIARPASGAPARSAHTAIVSALAAQLVLVVFTRRDAGDEYGPRYLFTLLGPGTLLAAAGYSRVLAFLSGHREWNRVSALPALGFGAVLAATAIRDHRTISNYSMLVYDGGALYRQVAGAHLSEAVVIVRARGSGTKLARNGANFNGPVLYVAPLHLSPTRVAAEFPGRRTFVADEEHGWSLTPVPP